MNSEKGQALPIALLVLAVGSLIIAPTLGQASSTLTGSRVYGQKTTERYSADAGVEHAIWNLTNGDLALQLPDQGDSITYQMNETVNGVTPSITVTLDQIDGGGGFTGEITDTVIDTLEFDTDKGKTPGIIHISGDVYAIAYAGDGDDGFLKTVEIGSDGQITNTVIDTLEFDPDKGKTPGIIHISGDVYVIAYAGNGDDGFLKTVEIGSDGQITNTVIDTLEFDAVKGKTPDIIHVAGDVYAIAYAGNGDDGFLKTVEIATDGQITNTIIDTLEFDTKKGKTPNIIHVLGDVYAIAYAGNGDDGFLKTVEIATDGQITDTVIDTLEFDTKKGKTPGIIHISGNVYAIVYAGNGDDGFLKTVEIATDGQITNTIIDMLEFDTRKGKTPGIVHISGNVYAIAYAGNGDDGFLKTVEIATDGTITDTVIDILEFDTKQGKTPGIIHVSGDVYVIAYAGNGDDGFLKTVEIVSTEGAFSIYTLESIAGDSTITSIVRIEGDITTILSWQVE